MRSADTSAESSQFHFIALHFQRDFSPVTAVYKVRLFETLGWPIFSSVGKEVVQVSARSVGVAGATEMVATAKDIQA